MRQRHPHIENECGSYDPHIAVIRRFAVALPDAIVVLDRGLIVRATNPALCQLIGALEHDLIDRSFTTIEALESLLPLVLDLQLSAHRRPHHREVDRHEMVVTGAAAMSLHVEVTMRVVDEIDPCVVLSIRDISKRKAFEAGMVEAKVAAENANAAKSDLVAMVAHEIRTAATGVGGLLQLIEQEGERARRFAYLKSAQRCASSLVSLVGDILDFSKLEAGKFNVEPRDFDLDDLLDTIDAFWRPQIEEKGLRFSIDRDDTDARNVHGDDLRLCQIIHNLLSNALKHTAHGEIRLTVIDLGNGARRVTVTDTGCGISDAVQHRLFRPFEQFSGSLAARLKGSGLGLAITRHLAEQMDGRAGVTSAAGQGSSFWVEVRLPDAPRPSADLVTLAQDAVLTSNPSHILIAEDNPINRLLLTAQLTSRGHRVTFVESGEEVIEMAQSGRFDAIVLDINLKGLPGDRTAVELRRQPNTSRPPIIGLTAFARSALALDVIHAFDELYEKGIDPRAFIEGLEAAIAAARQIDTALDTTQLDSLADHDRKNMLRLFARELAAFLDLCRSGAAEHLHETSHTVAGTAANFGARQVARLARVLGKCRVATAEFEDTRQDLVGALEGTLREVRQQLIDAPHLTRRRTAP